MKKKEAPSMNNMMETVLNGVNNAKEKSEAQIKAKQEEEDKEAAIRIAQEALAEKKKAEQERLQNKKSTRTEQRSVKFDKVTLKQIDIVKDIQKNNGVVRPSADDIIFNAVTEYLERYYPQTKAVAEASVNLSLQALGL